MLLCGKWQWTSLQASLSLQATHPWSPATLPKEKTPPHGCDSQSERNPSLKTVTLLPRRQICSTVSREVSASQRIWGHLKITLTWNTSLLESLLQRFREFWKSQQDLFPPPHPRIKEIFCGHWIALKYAMQVALLEYPHTWRKLMVQNARCMITQFWFSLFSLSDGFISHPWPQFERQQKFSY